MRIAHIVYSRHRANAVPVRGFRLKRFETQDSGFINIMMGTFDCFWWTEVVVIKLNVMSNITHGQ